MSRDAFTKDQPTEDGVYWYRETSISRPFLASVNGPFVARLVCDGLRSLSIPNWRIGEWAGPITPPRE